MTDPIQRATEALVTTTLTGGRVLAPRQALDAVELAFDSIDTDDLTNAIAKTHRVTRSVAGPLALAVKNWLTGKDQQ